MTLVAYRCTKCAAVRHERDDATAVWHQCRPLDRHQTALIKIPVNHQGDGSMNTQREGTATT